MSSKMQYPFYSPNCYFDAINLLSGNKANITAWHVYAMCFRRSIKMFHLWFDERHNSLPRTLIINFGNLDFICNLALE